MEKDSNIIIRLKESDKQLIQERAASEGMSLSGYARQMLLNGEIIKLSEEERITLSGLANNLNQLTRYLHSTGVRKPELEQVLLDLVNKIRHAYRQR